MVKQAINLLIQEEEETILLRKLKMILPAVAGISLFIFIAIFSISLIYSNININQFNALKGEVETLEKKIADQKGMEGVYTLTVANLNTLAKVLSASRNLVPILTEIENLKIPNITINTASADTLGNLSFSLTASSAADLDEFVNLLIDKEEVKHIFSNMNASGIARDKKGTYAMTVSLKADKSLLQ